MHPSAAAVPLALTLLLGACADTMGPGAIERLDVIVTLSQREMLIGDTVQIRVLAANLTDDVLEFQSSSCVLLVRIVSSAGDSVWPGPFGCLDILLIHRLAPGESIEETWRFDGTSTRYIEPERRHLERFPLPPGDYRVYGFVRSYEHSASRPVGLTILPADSRGVAR